MAGDVADTMMAGEALDAAEGLGGLWGVVNNAGINPLLPPGHRDPAVGVGRGPAGQPAGRRGLRARGRPGAGRGRRGRADRQPRLDRRAHRAAQHRPLQRLQGRHRRAHPHPGRRARPGRDPLQLGRPGHDRHRDGRGPDDRQPGPARRSWSPRRRSGASGTVAEAAWPIVFLLTDAASFITGQTLRGGRRPAGRRLGPHADRRLRGRHGRLRRRRAPVARTPPHEVTLLEVGPHYRPGRVAGRAHPLAPDHQGDPRLGLPGARRRLAAHGPRAARAGGGRLVGHQRRDRPARAPRALRRVGRPGRRLRLGELAALVPRDRGRPRLRRRRLARRRGADPDRPLPRAPAWSCRSASSRRPCRSVTSGSRPQRPRGARASGRSRSTWSTACARPRPTSTWTRRWRAGNLTLRAGVLVDRVAFSGQRVSGVVVAGPDGPETLPADAVVMALGTYATPAALLRSGIGPPEELGRHGIGVVAPSRGVGRGMQDHPKVSYRFELGTRGPALAEPLVPVPSDRRPRGRRRAARLPGDALLGPGRGRAALHRPQRPGGRRALAPRRRAPAEHATRPTSRRSRWAGSSIPPTGPRPSPPAGG